MIDDKSITSFQLLRLVLRHLYEYPKLARKVYADDFCMKPITDRLELAKKILSTIETKALRSNTKVTRPLPKPEELVDDLYHVIKLMKRYKLNFDQAFDYRLMNTALRNRYATGLQQQHYVPKYYAEINIAELLKTGETVGLTKEQVTPLLPSLKQKIKLGTERHLLKHGLFTDENDKTAKLEKISSIINENLTPKI